MKTSRIAFAFGIAILTLNTAFSQSITSTAPAGTISIPITQPQYPIIISQPVDQSEPFGSNAIFSVTALNADGYQWYFNGNAVTNGTNSSLLIQDTEIRNVGNYSCDVFNGSESVPTRPASLQVYTNWIDPQTGVDPMVVYSFPYPGGGSGSGCPGNYVGYVNYTPGANGWGWVPDTNNNNTIFTAADENQTNTKVEYFGCYGDEGCNQTTVTIPNPPFSPMYRFTIYFTNNVPTNAYPITLSGFSPP